MRHTKPLSRIPARAQVTGGVCDNINSNSQATLCFLLQLLTSFFLPVAQIKNDTQDQ
jgi:hypothetical protein